MIMDEADNSVATLRELKSLGVQLSLDDFGTGYSSLNYLRQFPLDTLKIDRSFINGITAGSQDWMLVKTMINLAANFRLRVIAEGVETREQADFLRAHDCDEMQGYYFSKPLPPEQMAALLETRAIPVS
jgi:EAL domain-containing protein (putative c-di-GMP-specific phosphodiesterase class I)